MQIKIKSLLTGFYSIIAIVAFWQTGLSQSTNSIIEERTVKYTRLYADASGDSHFDMGYFELKFKPIVAPDTPFSLSFKMENDGSPSMLLVPAGRFGKWHPAPVKQYMVNIQGYYEIEASDGEKRVFNPGDILLLEDTHGKGHQTKVIGEGDLLVVAIPVR